MSKKGVFGTIIGSDIRISGDMQFVGNALIEGYLEGNIKAEEDDSKLTISEHGHVKGSVVVPHLLVNGTIEGKVCVAERLEFGQKARIIGDVQYNLLEISVGARVDGKLIPKSEGGLVEEDKKTGAELSSGKTAPYSGSMRSIEPRSHRGGFAMSPPDKFDDRWYLIVSIAIPILLVVIVLLSQ